MCVFFNVLSESLLKLELVSRANWIRFRLGDNGEEPNCNARSTSRPIFCLVLLSMEVDFGMNVLSLDSFCVIRK